MNRRALERRIRRAYRGQPKDVDDCGLILPLGLAIELARIIRRDLRRRPLVPMVRIVPWDKEQTIVLRTGPA